MIMASPGLRTLWDPWMHWHMELTGKYTQARVPKRAIPWQRSTERSKRWLGTHMSGTIRYRRNVRLDWRTRVVRDGRANDLRACRQIISSFLRKQESRRFRIQVVLKQQGILDSRFRGNDGNGAV